MLSEDITSPVLPQKVINTDGETKATAAYTGRAGIKELLGDYDGAIADYTLLINSDPESVGQGYYGLGSAHYLKGEWQESLADLKHVLMSDRNSWFSNYARILSWLVQVRKGDRAGADKELSDALAQGVIEPSSWEEKVCAYLIDKSKEDDFLKQAASA